jgi:tricorn protease
MSSRLSWSGGIHFFRVNHVGPKAMLINGWAGSGGDSFPFFFKGLGVGPIIGERTWGGLIGPAVGHGLIDGGFFTAPAGRLYGPDGEWFPEGHGVEPDIPVVDDPAAMARGGDPQAIHSSKWQSRKCCGFSKPSRATSQSRQSWNEG